MVSIHHSSFIASLFSYLFFTDHFPADNSSRVDESKPGGDLELNELTVWTALPSYIQCETFAPGSPMQKDLMKQGWSDGYKLIMAV